MKYAHALRDVDDNIVTVFLKNVCRHTVNLIQNAP